MRFFANMMSKARIIPGLLICSLLAACVTAPAPEGAVNLQRSVSAFDGDVTLRAPRGYCLDPSGSQPQSENPVFFFVSCNALSGGAHSAVPDVMGLLSATVSHGPLAPGGGDHAALSAFFNTQAGQQLLSRRRGGSVNVQETSAAGDDYFWLLAEETRPSDRIFSPWIWFALTEVSGHKVTFRFYPASTTSEDPQAGRQTFHRFVRSAR